MNVGVILQGATPGVQDAEEPGAIAADVPGIDGEGLDRPRRGSKQRPIADLLVATQEGAQGLWHGEGDHEVRAGELTGLVPRQPRLALALLAAGAVSVAAGAMHDVLLPTGLAHVEGGARRLGMALRNGRDDLLVRLGHGRAEAVQVRGPVGAKEVLEEAHATGPPSPGRSGYRRPRCPCG